MQKYAEKVSDHLPELSENEIREQAMQWEFPPAQLWDAVLLTEMNAAVPSALLRRVWTEYILTSAILYWRFEAIFVDPKLVDRWVYVLTQ